jgi:hypothetical protein
MVATGIIILGNHGTLSSVEAVFSFHVPVITLQLYIYNCNYYCLSALCTLIHTMLLVVEKQTEIWFLHIVPNSKYCSTFIKKWYCRIWDVLCNRCVVCRRVHCTSLMVGLHFIIGITYIQISRDVIELEMRGWRPWLLLPRARSLHRDLRLSAMGNAKPGRWNLDGQDEKSVIFFYILLLNL